MYHLSTGVKITVLDLPDLASLILQNFDEAILLTCSVMLHTEIDVFLAISYSNSCFEYCCRTQKPRIALEQFLLRGNVK